MTKAKVVVADEMSCIEIDRNPQDTLRKHNHRGGGGSRGRHDPLSCEVKMTRQLVPTHHNGCLVFEFGALSTD
jgi:hypothetical protein